MKTVFSDISTIAHMWANKVQDNARNSSNNFFYSGNTIFSYGHHFPIAKHVVNDNGESAILFTEKSYSNTTAKHIAVVRQAARHLNIISCGNISYTNNAYTHSDNFNAWFKNAESVATNLLKAKKPEIYISKLSEISDKVNRYAGYFSIYIPETLKVALSIGNKEQYSEYQAKKEEFENQTEIAAKKELAAKHKKELAKWVKGETTRLYTHSGMDYLRLNGDRIETSQAVKIPLEIGKRIYNAIKDNSLQVGSKILDFTVNETGKVVKVGCHTFKTDYLLKFGRSVFN